MKFEVEFKMASGYVVASATRRWVGLAMLDRARQESGVPHLDAARVEDRIASCTFSTVDTRVELSEEEARVSGLFLDASRISIEVGRKLDDYVRVDGVVRRDDTTGEVESVRWVYAFNVATLRRHWIDAGCPLSWDVPGEEHA